MQQSIHRQQPLETSCKTCSSEWPRTVPAVREGDQISRRESSHEGCTQWCVSFPAFIVLSMSHHEKREVVYNKNDRIFPKCIDSFTPSNSGKEREKDQKKIEPTSNGFFALAQCEWTLNILFFRP